MQAVTDKQVMAYSGLVKSIAKRFASGGGTEFDDAYQEGQLAVFLALRAGVRPSKQIIRGRIINWCKFLRRLANNDAIAYEDMLPMEHHVIDEL